jgi:signal transduction histidine kinase
MATTREHVIEKLRAIPGYVELFAKAFSDDSDPINIENVTDSIALFEVTLITPPDPARSRPREPGSGLRSAASRCDDPPPDHGWRAGRAHGARSTTPANGRARACASAAAEMARTCGSRVEDDGPGIARSDREEVLLRGHRLDESTVGSGLGLAIVRDQAELYRGSLELSRSGLGGLRAALDLPAAA